MIYLTNLGKISRAENHTYFDVVERVAQHLELDDITKIQLTPQDYYSQKPKPNSIKYRSVDRLLDMLVNYNQVAPTHRLLLCFIVAAQYSDVDGSIIVCFLSNRALIFCIMK